jgi:hypothetical protein
LANEATAFPVLNTITRAVGSFRRLDFVVNTQSITRQPPFRKKSGDRQVIRQNFDQVSNEFIIVYKLSLQKLE